MVRLSEVVVAQSPIELASDRHSGRPLGREVAGVAAGVLVATLLLTVSERLMVGAFNDDGVYMALGQAIARGEGYRSIHLTGDPIQVKYPPGFPVLLAVLWWIGGTFPNVVGLVHILNAVVVATAAGALWYYGRSTLRLPVLPAAVWVLGPLFLEASLQYHSVALTEPYFVLGWALSLILAASVADAGDDRTRRATLAILLGATLAITTLFRSHAIVLIPGILLGLAFRRVGWRPLLMCTGAAALPLLAWEAVHAAWVARGHVSTLPDETSYVQWIVRDGVGETSRFVLATFRQNIAIYSKIFIGYLTASTALGTVLFASLGIAAGIGAYRARKERPELVLTVVASLALVLVWPFIQDRLALPILPFVGLLASRAIPERGRRWSRIVAGIAVGCTILALPFVAARQAELRADGLRSSEAGTAPIMFSPSYFLAHNSTYLEDVIRWVRDNTSPDDRILVEFPAGVYLYTGRKASNSNPSEPLGVKSVFSVPGEFLARRILEDGITVLVVGGPRTRINDDVRVVAERCPQVLRLVDRSPEKVFPLYIRVDGDAECLRGLVDDGRSESYDRPSDS